MNPVQQKTWGMLCLGGAVGLSVAWAVLNWLPFPELGFDKAAHGAGEIFVTTKNPPQSPRGKNRGGLLHSS